MALSAEEQAAQDKLVGVIVAIVGNLCISVSFQVVHLSWPALLATVTHSPSRFPTSFPPPQRRLCCSARSAACRWTAAAACCGPPLGLGGRGDPSSFSLLSLQVLEGP